MSREHWVQPSEASSSPPPGPRSFLCSMLSLFWALSRCFSPGGESQFRAHSLPEQVLPAIRAGLRFARHSPPLRRVLFATFLFMVCGAGVMALMPVLGRETGFGALGYGLLLGSLGVGAVTGGALLSRFRSRLAPEMVVTAGFIAFAAAALGAGTLRELFLLCPIMLIGGVAWLSVLSTCMVAAQEASPPWVRARVMAIYLMVFQAGIAGGSVLWGEVASSGRAKRGLLWYCRRISSWSGACAAPKTGRRQGRRLHARPSLAASRWLPRSRHLTRGQSWSRSSTVSIHRARRLSEQQWRNLVNYVAGMVRCSGGSSKTRPIRLASLKVGSKPHGRTTSVVMSEPRWPTRKSSGGFAI